MAVAIKYDKGQVDAPEVVAAGKGFQAEKILEKAKEHGVETHQDDELAIVLSKVSPGERIPVELYDAVAKVLAFLYRAESSR